MCGSEPAVLIEFFEGTRFLLPLEVPEEYEDYEVNIDFIEKYFENTKFSFSTNPQQGQYLIQKTGLNLELEFPMADTVDKCGDYLWSVVFYSEYDRQITEECELKIKKSVTGFN